MSELFKYPSKYRIADEEVADIIAEGCAGKKAAMRALIAQVRADEPQTALFVPENPAYVFQPSQDRITYLRQKLTAPVLDIGSGPSKELSHIIADELVVYADLNCPPEGGVRADVYDLKKVFAPGSFRSIYARSVLFETPKVAEGVTSMKHVLVPDGLIIIEEPFLADALAGLQQAGLDLDSQVDAKVFKSVWTHNDLGITFPVPNLLLEITNSAGS